MEFHHILSDDGTRLRAWTNDTTRPHRRADRGALQRPRRQPVDLAGAAARRLRRARRVLEPPRHRRLGPARATRGGCGIEEFVEDALSVMDHFGVDRAVLIGWSMGVNTAFELALRHPERVTGIFAVAGVPGDTFATMLGPFACPTPSHATSPSGCPGCSGSPAGPSPVTDPAAGRQPRVVAVLTHSGFMLPTPDGELAGARRARVPQHPGRVVLPPGPAQLRARAGLAEPGEGARDARRRDLRRAGRRPRHAHRLPTASRTRRTSSCARSHFVQMEQPEVVHDLLLDFLAEVEG